MTHCFTVAVLKIGVFGFLSNILLNSTLNNKTADIKRGVWTKNCFGVVAILIKYVKLLNSSRNTIDCINSMENFGIPDFLNMLIIFPARTK